MKPIHLNSYRTVVLLFGILLYLVPGLTRFLPVPSHQWSGDPLAGALMAVEDDDLAEDEAGDTKKEEVKDDITEKDATKRADALKKLKRDIRYAASEERRRAIGKVLRLKDEEKGDFVPLLKELALQDLDPLVRESCVRTLGEMKNKSAIPTFESALEDKNGDVRRSAVRAIRELDAKESAPALDKLVRNEDFSENNLILTSALHTLGTFRYTAIAPFLLEKAKDGRTNFEIRRSIILFLGNSRSTESYEYLLERAKDENEDVALRSYAVNALGKINNREAAPSLRKILDDIRSLKAKRDRVTFNPLKVQLIVAMIRLGDQSAVPEILATARDDDPTIRLRAIKQIGSMKLEQGRELLEYKSEHDPSVRVKKAARKALDQLDGKEKAEEESL